MFHNADSRPPQGMTSDTVDGSSRTHWVRLRTLILLRWVAISGQIIAIGAGRYAFQLELELGLCFLAIGTAVIANLTATFIYPQSKRLSESDAMTTLLFDIVQLSFLLYLCGGLNNPFALLLMAPVTIAATALNLKSTLVLGAATAALVTFLTFVFLPLRTNQGLVLEMPDIFRYGFWTALIIGVSFVAIYARKISGEIHAMSDALLATQLALAREQKLTDLGGVVAAAAHELGTPLATIKLVSAELFDELKEFPELRDDAALIRDQVDRCRDILRSMGRAGKDDLHMRHAPLDSVLREAAEPHQGRGKDIHYDVAPGPDGESQQPSIQRRPEIIHGLRNLIQNAVDFAAGNVWITARWTDTQILIRIIDDGAGFPPNMLGRIGDPYMRSRRGPSENPERPGYEGMGLGLFIAKTLLERTGAEMTFTNITESLSGGPARNKNNGALVEAVWARTLLDAAPQEYAKGLGANQPIPLN
jgi:two-component system sensor histidine kinase RegB